MKWRSSSSASQGWTSIASLLDRVSKLENAIKSGVKVQPTQTAVPAPKEEYIPKDEPKPQPKAEPTPVPMPEPELTPVEEEPPVREQQPVVETPPVEHKTAPPVVNQTKPWNLHNGAILWMFCTGQTFRCLVC